MCVCVCAQIMLCVVVCVSLFGLVHTGPTDVPRPLDVHRHSPEPVLRLDPEVHMNVVSKPASAHRLLPANHFYYKIYFFK